MRVRNKVWLSVLCTAAFLGLLYLVSPALFQYMVFIPAGLLFETTLGRLIPTHSGDHAFGGMTVARFNLDGAIGFLFWLVVVGVGTYLFVRHDDDWR